jgi:DinB family protein
MSVEGQELNHENFAGLLESLQATSNTLLKLIHGLSDSELRWSSCESEFSALENVCHLRDLEIRGYTPRINRILTETEPDLADFDGARVAAESNYNNETLDLAFRAFESARKQNVEKLTALTRKQLEREGTLEGVGRITLKRLAELMREHDEGHLEDLRVLRQRLENLRSA